VRKRSKDDSLKRLLERKAQRARELQAIIDRMTGELALLEARLPETADQNERIMIKAEIVHFTQALNRLHRGHYPSRRRKPPEAGLPVPAIPPGGPLPKQGGAAAPLEFDR
jgi:hypothetical protein